jgi:hypothetical protein
MCKNALYHKALVYKMSLKSGMMSEILETTNVRHQVCMNVMALFEFSYIGVIRFSVCNPDESNTQWVGSLIDSSRFVQV